ncbi:MAG: Hpt domain-containing protein [Desulfobacterales bacterium]|nr:Hpt domain-containing protein [Desulfobacterales bacterium]
MDDYISKPIDPNQLYSILLKWIKPGKREIIFPHEKLFEVDLPDKLPGIDISSGLMRVAGNKGLYKELLLKFYHKYNDVEKHICGAIETKDMDKIRELAHMIKGMAGNLGATSLQYAASDLELRVKENPTANLELLFDHFSVAFRQVISVIKEIDEDINKSQPDSNQNEAIGFNKEQLKPMMLELNDLINSDYGLALAQINRIKQMVSGTPLYKDLEQLEIYLEEFDDENQSSCLQKIIHSLN